MIFDLLQRAITIWGVIEKRVHERFDKTKAIRLKAINSAV